MKLKLLRESKLDKIDSIMWEDAWDLVNLTHPNDISIGRFDVIAIGTDKMSFHNHASINNLYKHKTI